MKNNKSKFSRTISAAMAAVTVAASLTGISSFALTPGDINNDRTVDVRDVVRLMKIIAGINVEYDHATCDTNGDGAVDSRDIVRLMKFISGQDVELFPIANTAVFYV